MRITQPSAHVLLAEENERALPAVLLAGALLCLFLSLRGWIEGERTEDILGPASGGLMFLFGAWFLYRRSSFRFDKHRETLTWSIERIGWSKKGVWPFASLRTLALVASIRHANGSGATYRLVLSGDEGELCLSLGTHDKAALTTAGRRLRIFLDMDPDRLTEDGIAHLLQKKERIAAIKMLRQEKGLSLTDAKREAERMTQR